MGKRGRRRPAAQQSYRPAAVHTDQAHAAITDELVRLTLGGQPARPELEVRL